MDRFLECFSEVPDPRAENALHDLTEMLFIALLATLCGAKGCCDIALFARTKEDLLRTVLVLKHGVPSHDTFSRVFRMLDPDGFEKSFRRFMKAFAQAARGVIALDGNPVPQPRAVETLMLGVAERIDAIVEMDAPGIWVLGSTEKAEREMGLGRVIEYAGASGAPVWIDPGKVRWDYRAARHCR